MKPEDIACKDFERRMNDFININCSDKSKEVQEGFMAIFGMDFYASMNLALKEQKKRILKIIEKETEWHCEGHHDHGECYIDGTQRIIDDDTLKQIKKL